jgi:hypothetical protein
MLVILYTSAHSSRAATVLFAHSAAAQAVNRAFSGRALNSLFAHRAGKFRNIRAVAPGDRCLAIEVAVVKTNALRATGVPSKAGIVFRQLRIMNYAK